MSARRGWTTLAAIAVVLVPKLAGATPPPTPDECATADETAQLLRKAGKIRAARDKLLVCVNPTCPTVVKTDCTQRLNEVERAIPSVVFDTKDGSGNDLTAVTVTMDGVPLVDHLDGTSVPLDPGKHRFVFAAAGASPVTRDLLIREGEKDRHESITFRNHVAASPASPDANTEQSAEPPDEQSRWPAYLAYAVGGAGLVAGIIFTIEWSQQNTTLAGECNGSACNQQYQGQISNLNTDEGLAIAGYGVAAVGAAIGTYLLLQTPSPKAQASLTRFTPRMDVGWVGLEGRF